MTGLAGNVVRAGAGIFGSTLLGLAIQVAVARGLGVKAFGLYGFGLAYVALWQVIMDGGSGILATREARSSRPGSLELLVALKPVLLAVGYVGLIGVARAAGFDATTWRVVAVLGIQAAGLATLIFAASIFRGHEEFGTESLHLVAQRVLFGLLVGAVLLTGGGVLGVSAAGALSYVVVSLVALALVGRRHGVRIRFDVAVLRAHWRGLARALGPLMLADGLVQVQMRSAQLILSATSGMVEVGVYSVARRLVEGLNLLPATFAMTLFPRLVAAWRESPKGLPGRLRLGLRFSGSLAAAVVVGGALWGNDVTRVLFGASYAAAGPVLRVLAGGLAMMTINAVLMLALIAVGRERAYAMVLALAAAVNLAANFALTQGLGAYGSAWAAVASEATVLAGCLLALRRVMAGFVPLREWTVLAVGGALAFTALLAMKQVSITLAASCTVGTLVVGFEVMSPLGFRDLLALRAGGAGAFDRAEV
jgi:O-antigen/teichoic acid export membrane protein